MIQRRQTLYLLISGLLMLAMIFVDIAKLTIGGASVYGFNSTGFEDLGGEYIATWTLFALNIVIVLLSFVAIFMYNKRVPQMRITMFNLILKIGFYGLAAFFVYRFINASTESMIEVSWRPTLWVSFPLIAMIFDYLAYRGIAIDEKTIQLSRSGRLR